MSAHVLLNLLNKLRKSDKIISLFGNEFNKFTHTRARKLDSILSYDIKITLKSHFWRKEIRFCHYVCNVVMDIIS